MRGKTHIWMSPNLFDNLFVKVTGIPQETAGDIIGMFKSLKYISLQECLGSLSKLALSALGAEVKVLHPGVVFECGVGCNMLFEDDYVRVRNLL